VLEDGNLPERKAIDGEGNALGVGQVKPGLAAQFLRLVLKTIDVVLDTEEGGWSGEFVTFGAPGAHIGVLEGEFQSIPGVAIAEVCPHVRWVGTISIGAVGDGAVSVIFWLCLVG
jgi:hypothetical protein